MNPLLSILLHHSKPINQLGWVWNSETVNEVKKIWNMNM